MATKSRNTPLTRLSRIGLAFGIGSTQTAGKPDSQGEDDSYIPYNGPYEPPTRVQEIRGYWDDDARDTAIDARSSSQFPSGAGKARSSTSNSRRYSDASRLTLSNVMTEPRRKFSRLRQNSSPPLRTSYVSLDQCGGVGDTPVPVHRLMPSRSQSSSKRRESVFRASMTDLCKNSSKGSRHGKSRTSGTSFDNNVPGPAASSYAYAQAPRRSRSNSTAVPPPQHPYPATPSLGTTPIQTNLQGRVGDRVDPTPKEIPAHLKPSSRAVLLKASLSTPDLRSASRRPALYDVKSKTHWLSAETWCDAFVFPRPRFLLRHLDEASTTPKNRLVSPVETIGSGPVEHPPEPKPSKKSLSMSELRTHRFPEVISSRVDRNDAPQSSSAPRPRSFALDDLALPSPIPSLMTVLTERQNLQTERQIWRERAAKSLGNKHTRSLSRSKSLGKTGKPSNRQPPAGTFDFLVERTLLGHQAIPSAIHTTANPSTTPMQTVSGGGQTARSFTSNFPRLRSKSHGHSKSTSTIHDRAGRRRRGSVSSAFHCAGSTAAGLCAGAEETPSLVDARDVFMEKGHAKVVALCERQQGATSPQSVVSVPTPTDRDRISPDRGFLVPSRQRSRVSPTSSSRAQSSEEVGIAISSPLPPDEYLDNEAASSTPHPYARGTNNHHRTAPHSNPLLETVQHRQPIVHPYGIHSAHPTTLSPQWTSRGQAISPARRMFAEIDPGRLREIHPEEIQYSPYIEDPPTVLTTTRATHQRGATEQQRSDTISRRDSDILRVGDALHMSLMRNRQSQSTDSGVGTSEDPHPYGPQLERTASSRSTTFPLYQVNEVSDVVDDDSDEGISHTQWLEPSVPLSRIHNDNSDPTSLHTVSSGRVDPSVFSDPPTPMRRMESSGSSPGLSYDSSPPLTPRPMGRLDDLERFQDLFYNPLTTRPELPPAPGPATEPENLRFSVSRVNLTGNRSQLTTLVRQLSEDLNDLRNEERTPQEDDQLEGLNNRGSEELVAPARRSSWSDGSSSVVGSAQLFLSTLPPLHPSEQPLVSLRENFPEDVESEVSSLSDAILEEDYDEITETLRLGSVEAVSTPPPIHTPHRLSGHAALVDDTAMGVIPSTSLLTTTGLARSSHLTIDSGGSRISGLSAFPRPPSDQSADILASYFVQERDDDDMPELISAALQSPVSPTGENQGEWTHPL